MAEQLAGADNGYRGRATPYFSVGTFAVSCSVNVNGLASFRVFRDGAVVADLGENGDGELTVPEVIDALVEMGIPGCWYPPTCLVPHGRRRDLDPGADGEWIAWRYESSDGNQRSSLTFPELSDALR